MTNITATLDKDKAIELLADLIRQGEMNLVIYLQRDELDALKFALNALRRKPICEG